MDKVESLRAVHDNATKDLWSTIQSMEGEEAIRLVEGRIYSMAQRGELAVLEFVIDIIEKRCKRDLFSKQNRDEAVGGLMALGELRDLLLFAIPSHHFQMLEDGRRDMEIERGERNVLERIY